MKRECSLHAGCRQGSRGRDRVCVVWTEGSTLYGALYEYSLAGLFGRDNPAALLYIFFLAAASRHVKGE